MNIKGQVVKHKVFGTGTIIENDGDIVIISFPMGDKIFQFPHAFKSFL